MRVFAGPNGSGKTTIFKELLSESEVSLGVYVNADEIEELLIQPGFIDFSSFELNINEGDIQSFFKESQFSPRKRSEPDLYKRINVRDNKFYFIGTVDSYLAADLAEFIRQQLLKQGVSFTYETVMSHPGKIDFLSEARNCGYRVYLYYIATVAPEINVNRVNIRVAQEGHFVPPEIVRDRYYRSLKNLKEAVKLSHRSYIFDNSEEHANLIAEVTNGTNVQLNDLVKEGNSLIVPNWVDEYLLKA